MNKSKKLFIITLTFLMLIGLTAITAADIDTNDTTPIIQTNQFNTVETTESNTIHDDTISTNEKSSIQTDNIQETINNKNEEKTQNLKADRTETASTYADLSSYLTSNAYDTVTINIGHDIQLAGNITVNTAIKTLTINGNQKTIDGNGQYQFLKIEHDINLFINNITITNCTATEGGAINQSGNITINNTIFTNNNAKKSGGAIHGNNNSIITVVNSIFTNNNASWYGGAIYGFENNITVTDTSFSNNMAMYDGAAIYANSKNYVTLTNTNLTNNKAYHSGGAIYGYSSIITLTNTILTDNFANQSGGAIYGPTNNNITIIYSKITNNVANNSGGFIAGASNNITIIKSNITDNAANQNGGAIYGFPNSQITLTDTSFTNNTAISGGAIYGYGNITMTNTNFTKNNASSGGVLFGSGNITLMQTFFTDNTANLGGAIYGAGSVTVTDSNFTDNIANNNGGAIFISTNSNLTISNSNLLNNLANQSGGAVYTNTRSNLTLTNSNLLNNLANQSGGAVYTNTNGTITITNSNFLYNNANNAGAIFASTNNITITDNNITNNNARYGGAISGNRANITIKDTNITNNTATNQGGAIYGYQGQITVTDTKFTNNNASNGGSIYGAGNNLTITDTSFTNNNATYGGAIHESNANITITDSNITNNTATSNGGAIYAITNNNITLKNSNITNNYVTSKTGYVIDFSNTNSVSITDNTFINNTDIVRDMLFSDAKDDAEVDIHGNSYIDNFLEVSIINPNVTVVTDNESNIYAYYVDVALRSIYNDYVHSGTLNVTVNGKTVDNTTVENGRARIFIKNSDLTERENNITFEYISDSYHYQNTTGVLNIYKEINTTLTIQAPSQMTAGETALINFTLTDVNGTPLGGETINVFVDEEQVDTITTDSGGVATYNFSAFGDKTVIIEGTYHPGSDSIYLSARDAEAEIEVSKIKPVIIIEHGDIIPHTVSNITIHLFDPDGNPIINKTLTVNITEEGKPDITGTVTTDENGVGVFNFTPVDEGTLNVTVTSPEDDIYEFESETVLVDKNFITTNLVLTPTNTVINKTNTISVEVIAGGALLSGTVELDIDGEIHNLTINNGRGAYHDYKSDTAGLKNVTAKFTSDNPSYANATINTEFNVDKLPTLVTIEVINSTAGNVTLKVLVLPKDDIESIVDGGNLVIESVNGDNRVVIYNDTLSNGELIYLTDINETGWYDFEVEYQGNDYFLGDVNNTGSVEVVLANTNTSVSDITAVVGDTITLNATVSDVDGNPVTGGNVTFLIDGKQLYDENDNPVEAVVENGIATVDYTLPATYTKGNYIITANYTGNNRYNTSSGNANLQIDPKETSIGGTPLNTTKGNTTIEVTLNSTEDNKPIPYADIIVTDEEGNPVGEGITDENGTAVITLDIPVGENDIIVSYLGNGTYAPQEEPMTINVTPRESKTTATIANNTVGNVTVDVLVVDAETGEPITGQVNIVIFDEIIGTGNLSDDGMASIPVDIDVKGNYTIIVEYMENDDYYGSSDTLENVTIDGKEADLNVSSDNPTVGNTTLNVTLTNLESGEPIPDAPIIVTLPNGTTVNGTTDKEGNVLIPVDLPSGENNLTVTYHGNDEYEAQEENITLKVKSYSTVTVDPVEGLVLDNVTFTAHVVDYQGNPVTGGYAQFNVGGKTLKDENGKNIRVLVENGLAKLSYKAESGWIVNTHPNLKVQAVYTGTSLVRENRSDTSKVTIYKRNATVTVSAPSDYVNGTLHIDATVRDQNGSLINEGVLVFKINGLSLKDENNKAIIATVVNGTVHLDVKLPFAYSAKEYNLTAVYSNKAYNKVTGSNITSLKAIPTYVNATVIIKDEYSKPVVAGQIYNKFNDAILEGTVTLNIKFDGSSYVEKAVINNGTFNKTLEGISIYKPGTHKVEVVSGDTYHYQGVRKTYTTKATSKYDVTTEFINITRNKTTTRVQARIVDMENNNVQRNLTITIKLNGKSFLVNRKVIDGMVDVLIDTSSLSNRNYTLELVSGANTYYNAGKATAELPKY